MESNIKLKLPIKIGQGYDIHKFGDNRKLIIGGVHIPYNQGLIGHSDADPLLHAIIDALLGAAGLGDIGQHFPDTDNQFANIDSKILLGRAYKKVKETGYILGNLDATVIAEKPKLSKFIPFIIQEIATCLMVLPTQINVKAKTNEKLGYLGQAQAIAVHAVALLIST